jgi:histidine triad (HIT) family protein
MCLFCKIIGGEIPAKKIFEDDRCVAIRDVNPQAPSHVLVLPRKHVATMNDLAAEDEGLAGHLLRVGAQIAKQEAIDQEGYRLVFNTNANAGQTVFHIHLHVLGGRVMGWPPG